MKSKIYMHCQYYTSRWLAVSLAVAAHRLATTEQSVVTSWTRSIALLASMVGVLFTLFSCPSRMSLGRRQPSKTSSCTFDRESSPVSVNGGRSKSDGSGGVHGGNTHPFNLEL